MKKNLLKLVVVVIAIIAFNACNDANTPEAVVEKYFAAMENQDWDEAKKLSTKETHEMVDLMKSFADMAEEDAEKEEMKVTDIECEIDGEECECSFKMNGEEDKITLLKQDGKWLVHQPKEMGDEDWDLEGEEDWDWEEDDDLDWEEEVDEVVEEVEEIVEEV
jgi:hypothetical protein